MQNKQKTHVSHVPRTKNTTSNYMLIRCKRMEFFRHMVKIKVSQKQFEPQHTKQNIQCKFAHSFTPHAQWKERERQCVVETRKNSHIWKSCSYNSMRLPKLKWGARARDAFQCVLSNTFKNGILQAIRSIFYVLDMLCILN